MTKIIGLTGPSGSGKCAVSRILKAYGIPSVDTDAVYHDLLLEEGPCTRELTDAFGPDILDMQGLVDRKKLAGAVFGHPDSETRLHTLNRITHKYIMAKTHELVHRHTEKGVPAVVIDAPLLFEAGVDAECDLVLGVIAPPEICIRRIMERDGIPEQAARMRLASQHDSAFFRQHCHAVVENNTSIEALEAQICQFLKDYGVITA